MNADVYSSLLRALALPDKEGTSCYPVRVSAAGGIVALLDVSPRNNVFDWLIFNLVCLLTWCLFAFCRMTACHLSGILFSKL